MLMEENNVKNVYTCIVIVETNSVLAICKEVFKGAQISPIEATRTFFNLGGQSGVVNNINFIHVKPPLVSRYLQMIQWIIGLKITIGTYSVTYSAQLSTLLLVFFFEDISGPPPRKLIIDSSGTLFGYLSKERETGRAAPNMYSQILSNRNSHIKSFGFKMHSLYTYYELLKILLLVLFGFRFTPLPNSLKYNVQNITWRKPTSSYQGRPGWGHCPSVADTGIHDWFLRDTRLQQSCIRYTVLGLNTKYNKVDKGIQTAVRSIMFYRFMLLFGGKLIFYRLGQLNRKNVLYIDRRNRIILCIYCIKQIADYLYRKKVVVNDNINIKNLGKENLYTILLLGLQLRQIIFV
ncbi:hypothetical protein AGLY_000305 [Aphis glycines]|uniref:Uncharacterized protein n=1 Tax=Aphis glycines TaxID=307491 RepID=A0A6G0U740_APHGL|nr:hypothetical protein AGLY_000305 [Aphis glycines]